MELLRTVPLPIHKVIIIAIFLDGMNGIYLYLVNKLCLVGRYWDFNKYGVHIIACTAKVLLS